MTTTLARRLVLTWAVVVGLALAGCATSPATRFYVLTPVPPGDAAASPASVGITIGLRSVTLPDELDRPQIVTRTGPNTVQIAEFDRWSGSLRDSVMQLLAANLATLLPGDQVTVYPWRLGTSVDREAIVDITRFDCEMAGQCALQARWRVLERRGTPSTDYGQSTLSVAAGRDYAALVATQSRLIGALSAAIARAIRGTTNREVTASRPPETVTNGVPASR